MKLFALFALVPLAAAQAVFNYSDGKGDLAIRARDAQGTAITDANSKVTGYKFKLKGGAHISSKRQGFTLDANQITADAVTSKDSSSPNEIRSAQATGNVQLNQGAANVKSTMKCGNARYQAKGDTAKVTAGGGVTLTNFDSKAKQALTATGSNGTATLDKKASEGYGLRDTTLTGSVRVEIKEEASDGVVVFTGDRLTIDAKKITLSGHVKGNGKAKSRFGSLSNVSSIVVNLNAKREMTSFSFKSGGAQ